MDPKDLQLRTAESLLETLEEYIKLTPDHELPSLRRAVLRAVQEYRSRYGLGDAQ